MTLNILFFSITIKKRELTIEEAVKQELAEKVYEDFKDRRITLYHTYFN